MVKKTFKQQLSSTLVGFRDPIIDTKRIRKPSFKLNYGARTNIGRRQVLSDGRTETPRTTPTPSPAKKKKTNKVNKKEQQPDLTWYWKKILVVFKGVWWAQNKKGDQEKILGSAVTDAELYRRYGLDVSTSLPSHL